VAVYSGNATTQNTLGCTGGDYKRVVATGSAAAGAVAGNTSGQTRKMEAVFYLPAASAPSPGFAILGGAGTAISNVVTVNASGDVYIASGDYNCQNNMTITGSLTVADGKLTTSGSCKVTGDVYAKTADKIDNTTFIGGNLVIAESGVQMSGNGADAIGSRTWVGGNVSVKGNISLANVTVVGNVTSSTGTGSFSGATRVGGDFRVAGAISMDAPFTVGGMITSSAGTSSGWASFKAGSMRLASLNQIGGGAKITGDVTITSAGSGTVAPDVTIGGQLRSTGTLNSWGSGPSVGGSTRSPAVLSSSTGGHSQVSGLIPADVPAAPTPQTPVAFPRVTYKPADWQAQGFTTIAWAAGSTTCKDTNNLHWMSETLSSYGTATVVDTRAACPAGLQFDNTQRIKLKGDVAIIANDFTTTNNFYIESGDGATHKMWMIVPAADTGAICQYPSGRGQIKFSVGYGSAMPLMLYSPCKVSLTNEQAFPGQVWGGSVDISVKTTIDYVPMGIPGVTLTPVGGTPPPSAPSTLQLLSKRDTTG
jgi:hypothetical protein